MNEPTDLNASSAPEIMEQTPQNQDPYAALTLPGNSLISPAALKTFKQSAAEINLPLQMLQKWVEQEEIRLQQEVEHQARVQKEQCDAWIQQTQDLLGDKWQEEVSRAVRAADIFGGPELRQLLEETGLGNHPAIVRTFVQVGKRIREDISAAGAPGACADKTFTQALYGKQ